MFQWNALDRASVAFPSSSNKQTCLKNNPEEDPHVVPYHYKPEAQNDPSEPDLGEDAPIEEENIYIDHGDGAIVKELRRKQRLDLDQNRVVGGRVSRLHSLFQARADPSQ